MKQQVENEDLAKKQDEEIVLEGKELFIWCMKMIKNMNAFMENFEDVSI